MGLTVEAIATAKPKKAGDRWLSDKTSERNAGRLALRISPNGVRRFYYRYSVNGARTAMSLGVFTREPKLGFVTLDQARARARELSDIYKNKSRDVRNHLAEAMEQIGVARAAEADLRERDRVNAEAAKLFNLGALAAEYAASLEQRGKGRTAADARSIFKCHLNSKAIALQPAKDVHRREITSLLREVVEAGKGRTAAKLRSYLHAAYQAALHAEGDATAPSAMVAFNVQANPVAGTRSLSHLTRAGQRALNADEIRHYWRHLLEIKSEAVRGALQIALLLGGQRIQQLLRLTRSDVDLAERYIVLRDPKGRRTQPRLHELPLPDEAASILRTLVARAASLDSSWVFTTDGEGPLDHVTLTVAAKRISSSMVDLKESTESFSLRDIRRTAETLLAKAGVSQDLRAQIQSHGLGGVQQRHYDRHDYRAEKRKVLDDWAAAIARPQTRSTSERARISRRRSRLS